jgi:hypothetical protein
MIYFKLLTVTILMTLGYLLLGCSINSSENAIQHNDEAKFVIVNYMDEYNYFIYLNGDPLFFSNSRAIFSWKGFPIVSGENELKLVYEKTPNYSGSEIDIRMYLTIYEGTEIVKQINIEDALNSNKVTERLIDFNAEIAQEGSIDFLPLSNIRSERVYLEVKRLSLRLIELLRRRKFETISNMIRIKDVSEIKSKYPSWFLESDSKLLKIKSVEKDTDIDVLVGKTTALVMPKQELRQQNMTPNLLFVQNRESKASISITSMLFALTEDGWGIFGEDGQFYLVLGEL